MRLISHHVALVLFFAVMPIVSSSVMFTSLKDANGKQICANRTSLGSLTIQTVSVIQCSIQCVQEKQCYFFNYFKDRNTCQMFSGSPFKRYAVVPNCACYKSERPLPQDCLDIRNIGSTTSGVYTIFVGGDVMAELSVYCDMETSGGGWLVLQRRLNGVTDFYRDWKSYVIGFGNISNEFWLGNDNIHSLTKLKDYTAQFDLADFSGQVRYAEYTNFQVDSSANFYRLTFTGYSGDAGDAMGCDPYGSNGQYFTTFDRDHDTDRENCAVESSGAWWYSDCHNANLNGLYLRGDHKSYADGIEWNPWHGYYYSLRSTEIKIRPV